MTTERYLTEILSEDDDDGTMPNNVDELKEAVVGHKIAKAEKRTVDVPWCRGSSHTTPTECLVITLDDGREVRLSDESDCCAYTDLEAFLLHPERVNHMITGVGTTEGYTRWHIYADMGDVLELTVGWSAGNPFYYGYGFGIYVEDMPAAKAEESHD